WRYPLMLEEVEASPGWLAAFHTYLSEQGFQPSDFGAATWDPVMPIGASTATTAGAPVETRRLFYWTMRYFAHSSAQACGPLRNARLNPNVFPNLRAVYANWGGENWLSRWYGNDNITQPATPNDTASGSVDWLDSSRLAVSSPFTEVGENIRDQQAEQLSTVSDVLRSAALLTWQNTPGANVDPNNIGSFPSEAWQNFGMNVGGIKIGGFPSGASYRILSVLGHGGKAVNVPVFGPAPLTSSEGW